MLEPSTLITADALPDGRSLQGGGLVLAQTWSQLVPSLFSYSGSGPPVSSPLRLSLGGRQPLEERDFQAGLRFRIKLGHEKGSDGEGWWLG